MGGGGARRRRLPRTRAGRRQRALLGLGPGRRVRGGVWFDPASARAARGWARDAVTYSASSSRPLRRARVMPQ